MIGNNTITVNQATITEAMQEYFDKGTTEGSRFKVVGVKVNKAQHEMTTFVVSTTDPEPKSKESK